jgi:small GTP-binding protein
MAEDFKYDVFLGHSLKDKEVVRPIAERLRADGLRVWFDEWEIKVLDTESRRVAKLEEGLERSRSLVLCTSANMFGSEWAQLESSTFRFRDPLNYDRRFIPLRLDEAPIKGHLAQFLFIDWLTEEREQAYMKILEACRQPATPTVIEPTHERSAERARKLEYKAKIFDYAFSPDGRCALTGGWDRIVHLWDLETGHCLGMFEGHTGAVRSVAWSIDQRHILSSSDDKTIRLWDMETKSCLRILEGHKGVVRSVVLSADQSRVLSSSDDQTVRLWDVVTGRCELVLEGHTDKVANVAWSSDPRLVLSGSYDDTVRLWDVQAKRCLSVLEGHTDRVMILACSADHRRALSGSNDQTVRLWDLKIGRCLRVLKGHTNVIRSLAWSPDQRRAISGSDDGTLRLWDLETGRCLRVLLSHKEEVKGVTWSADQCRAISGDVLGGIRFWDLSEFATGLSTLDVSLTLPSGALDQIQYTNAKVLLVGESGAGKTGLTERLAHDTFTPSYSTSGNWSTQWKMKDLPLEPGWEREVWLWDFGGQADQRLIHQLYLEKTVLILLVFNADREVVLPGLREWQQALSRCVPDTARTYLVAGRIDVGFRFDREKIRAFAQQHDYLYFETSAFDSRNCAELRKAIQTGIPWTQLERRTSPTIWKLLKDEVLKLRDEGLVLFTFKELRETLRQHLSAGTRFTDADLDAVVALLDGPGVVKELGFGTYILLRPEWINSYAQAVIRTLRAEPKNLGCLPVQSIASGNLIFQAQQASGEIVEEKRLGAREEPIVLQAMEQMLLERRLCLRQEGNLVFPSYCGIEKPMGPVPPKYFVSYVFGGFLDDVYATLVVKLVYCGAFSLKELWRDAADFETLADHRTTGIKLLRNDDGRGTLLVHFSRDVTQQEQVIFANYIHEHLLERATEPQRQRFYVCPHCDTPVRDGQEAMRRVEEQGKMASIICVHCEKRVPLWDALEERFASDETKQAVALLQEQERFELDTRRKGQMLVHEVAARINAANQKCTEIPGSEDEGLDMEVEFTDDDGRGTGKRIYLQLKAGNSYLDLRKSDGAEIFRIKKQSWVKYWLDQGCPVMLVVGTFLEETEEFRRESKEGFAEIRWMEISDVLRRESKDGKQPVRQIVFEGERLDVMSVRRWRDRVLRQGSR